jgi:hypothetical protein
MVLIFNLLVEPNECERSIPVDFELVLTEPEGIDTFLVGTGRFGDFSDRFNLSFLVVFNGDGCSAIS